MGVGSYSGEPLGVVGTVYDELSVDTGRTNRSPADTTLGLSDAVGDARTNSWGYTRTHT